ncbi:hypothetical protein I5E68_18865 [Novosphingobium sp. YJ-S2-02]|uniref:Uncharacterized protein n=1 Tax=Novosphingobium aureum TaxID=2792964 RepID=A0A931MMD0_9SPHN|nr:hypothetical protein [Novosphingobium aureum]MBH0115012.1 hypothetical protein [Novosphingobium aureum]
MTDIAPLFPRWASTWGELARTNALARSQCRCCGMQQRVDVSIQILRFGANGSPIDLRDKCMVVGCHGTVFYLAARTYGRQWIALDPRSDPRGTSAPGVNAVTLNIGATKPYG